MVGGQKQKTKKKPFRVISTLNIHPELNIFKIDAGEKNNFMETIEH